MNALFAILALTAILIFLLLAVPARILAAGLRNGLPLILGGVGTVLVLAGRSGLGGALILMALAIWRRMRGVGSFGPKSGRGPTNAGVSSVRSAALEMELDHRSGEMNGLVLVGSFEGQELDQMSQSDLISLRIEIADDGESVALLDAYLDRRFPGWGENAEFEPGAGQGGPPRTGPMGEKEAYEVLGLAPGAGVDEIRKAHRRLMKGMHPDSGGSTFLAAKINEAKDVLLKSHS